MNGILLVASVYKPYLTSAQMLADSIKEYSNIPITLFTIDEWKNDAGNHVFDNVVSGAPPSKRAKLWALPQTPYEITCYIDADMLCQSAAIKTIFSLIEDNDIVFTKIRPYAAAKIWWKGVTQSHPHGGFFLYRNNKKTLCFMREWWDNWLWFRQNKMTERWKPLYHPLDIQEWDQFPLGLMLGVNDKDDPWYRPDIKWDYIKGKDCIYNYIHVYDRIVERVKEEDIILREVKTPLFNRIHQFHREFYHDEDSCYSTNNIK